MSSVGQGRQAGTATGDASQPAHLRSTHVQCRACSTTRQPSPSAPAGQAPTCCPRCSATRERSSSSEKSSAAQSWWCGARPRASNAAADSPAAASPPRDRAASAASYSPSAAQAWPACSQRTERVGFADEQCLWLLGCCCSRGGGAGPRYTKPCPCSIRPRIPGGGSGPGWLHPAAAGR